MTFHLKLIFFLLLLLTIVQLFWFFKGTFQVDQIPRKQISFEKWKNDFQKVYKSQEEELYRREIFEENLNFLELHRKQSENVEFSLNKFMDLTKQEFKNLHLGLRFPKLGSKSLSSSQEQDEKDLEEVLKGQVALEEVDWRKNKKYWIKNQGGCGGCWAFSTVAVLEYKSELNFSLSQQNLIDCDTENEGCGGGWYDQSFKFMKNNGVHKEADYPYISKSQTCKDNVNDDKVYSGEYLKFNKFTKSGNCQQLKTIVSNYGPAAVAVYTHQGSLWNFYKSGILAQEGPLEYEDPESVLDHAVVVVGYNKDYWIVQNSWGTDWGENGFVKVKMGNEFNICMVGYNLQKTTQQIQDSYGNN